MGARAGWDIIKLMGYLGHADAKTTQRYAHHMPKHSDAAALNGLVEAEFGAGQGVPAGV
jgi:integrase